MPYCNLCNEDGSRCPNEKDCAFASGVVVLPEEDETTRAFLEAFGW